MSPRRVSAAMTVATHDQLRRLLLRPDGQEDVCLATYRPSTGATRCTAIVRDVVLPFPGEREVQGNASVTGDYVLRAATIADRRDEGLVVCHSRPTGRGWQEMSAVDREAESSFANLVRELTGLPLVGMTLAGQDSSWSARHWDHGAGTSAAATATDAESVRVVGDQLEVSWNDTLAPPPGHKPAQRRSISCWGPATHDDLVRRSVLVVGAGSIGLDVATRLAATGTATIGIMDFDIVEVGNLDRLIGVTVAEAWLQRPKVEVARRLVLENVTASEPTVPIWDHSVCESDGLLNALDFDLIMCCVDRPWPRAVLNAVAYADLIPVIDGGIAVDPFPDGDGMRNATWRSHVIRPGRPCLSCNGQLDLGDVTADREGVPEDPQYVSGQDRDPGTAIGENVAILSVSAAAALLAQFVSFNVGPGGLGDPGPLQYVLSTNTLEHLRPSTSPRCPYEAELAVGDARQTLTGRDQRAEAGRARGGPRRLPPGVRIGRVADDVVWWLRQSMIAAAGRRLGERSRAAGAAPGQAGPGQ